MRGLFIALAAATFALTAATVVNAAEDCRTGDAAICLSRSACHWDYQRRGCYEGPSEQRQDGCASHSDKAICEIDKTLGCQWSAEKNACESRG